MLTKYLKRIWFLTTIPFGMFLIAMAILEDIILGRVDEEDWRYWK